MQKIPPFPFLHEIRRLSLKVELALILSGRGNAERSLGGNRKSNLTFFLSLSPPPPPSLEVKTKAIYNNSN
jgi:hypothetical protein